MPWKECGIMEERWAFVRRSQERGVVFRALCTEYGISTKTGYKWLKRYEEGGRQGLRDESRRPKRSPRQTEESRVCGIVRMKQAHPKWGPKKIRWLCEQAGHGEVSLSTVKRVLRKAGMVEARPRRRAGTPGRLVSGVESRAPNDVWTVDFKGWWRVGAQRCEPLTLRDAYSRYVLSAQSCVGSGWMEVKALFIEAFERYGLPLVIQSDNGSPFACTRALLGLSRLSVWWLAQGIDVHRSRPGCPQDNGGHERMHLDIRREIEGLIHGGLAEQQAALEAWRAEFNEVRPHEALEMRRPVDLYRESARRYEAVQAEGIVYGAGFMPRQVTSTGHIKVERRSVFVSTALTGWPVGLKHVERARYELWFAQLQLGELDVETQQVKPARAGVSTLD